MTIRANLEAIQNRGLIDVRQSDGAIIWKSIIDRDYPDIDIQELLWCAEDNLFIEDGEDKIAWEATIKLYLVREELERVEAD